MDEAPFSVLQLSELTEALRLAESEHRQELPLLDGGHIPVGCSCGVSYGPNAGWEDSKQHLREVMARAMLGALHRPCDSCLGSGIWRRLRRDYECPECDGRGRTLTPLPPMAFQDDEGNPWVVDRLEGRDRDLVWAQVFRDA
jgi:hypothetical protein